MRRTKNVPGKLSGEELELLTMRATAEGLDVAAYVRRKLDLPEVKHGAPAGIVQNPFGRKGKPGKEKS